MRRDYEHTYIYIYNDLEGFRDGRRAYKYKAENFKQTIFFQELK